MKQFTATEDLDERNTDMEYNLVDENGDLKGSRWVHDPIVCMSIDPNNAVAKGRSNYVELQLSYAEHGILQCFTTYRTITM